MKASTEPEVFLNRIREWFKHSFNDDWEEQDRQADLDMHFPLNGILAIYGDNWNSYNFHDSYGYFNYWKEKSEFYIFIDNPQPAKKGIIYYPPAEVYSELDTLLKYFYFDNKEKSHIGLWFRLKSEPKPCSNTDELYSQINNLSDLSIENVKEEINNLTKSNIPLIIALIYPKLNNELTWFYLKIDINNKTMSSYKTCGCDSKSFNQRIQHIKPVVENKQIAIFGVGAIGSSIALLLGKHCFKTLKLIDSDSIEPKNIVRHTAGLNYTSFPKTFAVSVQIGGHSPYTKIILYEETSNPDKIKEIIEDVDLVIDATANSNFSQLLNHISIEQNKTSIYVTSHRKAFVGKIRVVRPHIDSCLCCYEGQNGILDNYDKYNYPYIPSGEDDEIHLGCGNITYPAIAADVEFIANWAVKIVLWLLQDKFYGNHLLIINDMIEDMPEYLCAIGHKFNTFQRLEGCDVCQK